MCSSFICRLQEGLKKAVTPSNKRMFISVDNFNIANICKCYQSKKAHCRFNICVQEFEQDFNIKRGNLLKNVNGNTQY